MRRRILRIVAPTGGGVAPVADSRIPPESNRAGGVHIPRSPDHSLARGDVSLDSPRLAGAALWPWRIGMGPALATALSLAVLSTTPALGQSGGGYKITTYTVDGGGDTCTSTNYTVSGTAGQCDAGSLTGSSYSITGGYWTGVSAGVPLVPPALPADTMHQAPKNRYITIDTATNASESVAYQVSLSSMRRCSGDLRRACIVGGDCPGVCDNDNDLQCSDDGICGGGTCIPTSPCIEHGDVGSVTKYIDTPYTNSCVPLDDCTTQWFAQLTDTPVYRMWTEDAVHIFGCRIVPVARYEVQATSDGVSFSDPLTIGTIPKPQVHYGDCVGPVSSGEFAPPDGFTNVVDVQAFLAAQGGAANAPHTTWVDLQSGSLPVVPQQILNVGDLQTIKAGFTGSTYVNTPGHENPGDCP